MKDWGVVLIVSGAARWLGDDIDQAVRDGARSVAVRLLAAAGNAGFLVANFDTSTGALWMAVNVLAEMYIWAATRPQADGRPGSMAHRLNFVIASALMTANWSATAVLYWFSTRHGLQIVSILVLTGQLIHAQAFAYKSNAILLVTAGIPAVSLAVLPLVFGGLQGSALASAAFALTLTLGYAAASARANMKAAVALQTSYEDVHTLAYFDSLTALANRRMFNEDFERFVSVSSEPSRRFALLLVDVDRLKQVNDTLGHAAGDALLVQVSVRLRGLIRASDTLARIGGDEFAILTADAADPEGVVAICQRIMDAFETQCPIDGAAAWTTVSVGVAVYPDHGRDQDALYKASDLALYAAKKSGRNAWRVFSPTWSAGS
jgi:diguanylate cyclase (GGDEF)-like protein